MDFPAIIATNREDREGLKKAECDLLLVLQKQWIWMFIGRARVLLSSFVAVALAASAADGVASTFCRLK